MTINQYETLITRDPVPNDPWCDIEPGFYALHWNEGVGTWGTFYASIRRHFGKHHLTAAETKSVTLAVSRGGKQLFAYDVPPEDCLNDTYRGGMGYHWTDTDGISASHSFCCECFFFDDFFTPGHYAFEFTIVPHEGNTVFLKYPIEIV